MTQGNGNGKHSWATHPIVVNTQCMRVALQNVIRASELSILVRAVWLLGRRVSWAVHTPASA